MTNVHNIVVICDNIRSLYNVGAIFRTSDGAGVNKIFLCGMTGYPKQNDPSWTQTEKIAKTALGAEKNIPWQYIKSAANVILELKKQGYHIYALENNLPNTKISDFRKIAYQFPLALVVGHEVVGIKQDTIKLVDHFIQIPMAGKKESLNVAVAFGIAIYEIAKNKKAA